MSLIVNEIFCSIQGESLYAGRPCAFIRLTGCNLRCTYCDTQYAYAGGQKKSLDDITSNIQSFQTHLVEITGGEPLMQPQTRILVEKLLSSHYTVLIETNGSFDISQISPDCIKIMDIKCPGSGESKKNDLDNLHRLQKHDQIKFVIGDRNDYRFAKEIIQNVSIPIPNHHILMSCVNQKLMPDILAAWILEDHLDVTFQLQLHKIIWPDITRGV